MCFDTPTVVGVSDPNQRHSLLDLQCSGVDDYMRAAEGNGVKEGRGELGLRGEFDVIVRTPYRENMDVTPASDEDLSANSNYESIIGMRKCTIRSLLLKTQ